MSSPGSEPAGKMASYPSLPHTTRPPVQLLLHQTPPVEHATTINSKHIPDLISPTPVTAASLLAIVEEIGGEDHDAQTIVKWLAMKVGEVQHTGKGISISADELLGFTQAFQDREQKNLQSANATNLQLKELEQQNKQYRTHAVLGDHFALAYKDLVGDGKGKLKDLQGTATNLIQKLDSESRRLAEEPRAPRQQPQ